jgi:biopolymer transport protein ExbB
MGFYSMVAFFQKGGMFMYPILLVFAAGMAIAFERWIQLHRVRGSNETMWGLLHPVLVKGEFDKAREMANKDKSSMSQMLGMGLARQGAVRRREDIEIAMEESMMEIIPQLEKRTPYVALLANIATLLGLLGTIMGLIEAFTAVANANPAEKADLLSASISVAMNTTAFGLMSAIPLLLLHADHDKTIPYEKEKGGNPRAGCHELLEPDGGAHTLSAHQCGLLSRDHHGVERSDERRRIGLEQAELRHRGDCPEGGNGDCQRVVRGGRDSQEGRREWRLPTGRPWRP